MQWKDFFVIVAFIPENNTGWAKKKKKKKMHTTSKKITDCISMISKRQHINGIMQSAIQKWCKHDLPSFLRVSKSSLVQCPSVGYNTPNILN